jgi:GDP-D-mannose dehydratase
MTLRDKGFQANHIEAMVVQIDTHEPRNYSVSGGKRP